MNTFEVPISYYLRANGNRLPKNKNVIIKEGSRSYFISEPELATITTKGREDEDLSLPGVRGMYNGEVHEAVLIDTYILLPIEALKECNC